MLAELIFENGMVWLVSASDQQKYETVPALQDNVELGVNIVSRHVPLLHWFVYLKAATALHFLIALLALAFSVLWDQVPYSGFGIMTRVVATIAASRLIRIACFMSTVLPNPRPGCYARRFPPVPASVWETVKLGYTTIRGFGGCNDLIFSGHGAFWTLAPLAHQSYYHSKGGWSGSRTSTALLWLMLIQSSLRDVMEHHHYSVDMVLAVVVTWACWTWLEWVYPPSQRLQKRLPGSPPDKMEPWVLGVIAFGLFAAAVIIIGGRA
mmetsp:Transcript_8179/g.17534  ORF Transcript_8179/g.17534 Transcript_8179/m.17534 type:complete len:266 (+) Transcript_8179:325-1122(+)